MKNAAIDSVTFTCYYVNFELEMLMNLYRQFFLCYCRSIEKCPGYDPKHGTVRRQRPSRHFHQRWVQRGNPGRDANRWRPIRRLDRATVRTSSRKTGQLTNTTEPIK